MELIHGEILERGKYIILSKKWKHTISYQIMRFTNVKNGKKIAFNQRQYITSLEGLHVLRLLSEQELLGKLTTFIVR